MNPGSNSAEWTCPRETTRGEPQWSVRNCAIQSRSRCSAGRILNIVVQGLEPRQVAVSLRSSEQEIATSEMGSEIALRRGILEPKMPGVGHSLQTVAP